MRSILFDDGSSNELEAEGERSNTETAEHIRGGKDGIDIDD